MEEKSKFRKLLFDERIKPKNVLALNEKVAAIRRYEIDPVYKKIGRMFNCSPDQIKRIVKQKTAILAEWENRTRKPTTPTSHEIKTVRASVLGKAVHEWIRRIMYYTDFNLNDTLIQTMALEFSKVLEMGKFYPHVDWISNFRATYNLPDANTKTMSIGYQESHSVQIRDILRYVKESSGTEAVLTANDESNMECSSTPTVEIPDEVGVDIQPEDDDISEEIKQEDDDTWGEIKQEDDDTCGEIKQESDNSNFCGDIIVKDEEDICQPSCSTMLQTPVVEISQPSCSTMLQSPVVPEKNIIPPMRLGICQPFSSTVLQSPVVEISQPSCSKMLQSSVVPQAVILPSMREEMPMQIDSEATNYQPVQIQPKIINNESKKSSIKPKEKKDPKPEPEPEKIAIYSHDAAISCVKLLEEFALLKENFRLIGLIERLEEALNEKPAK